MPDPVTPPPNEPPTTPPTPNEPQNAAPQNPPADPATQTPADPATPAEPATPEPPAFDVAEVTLDAIKARLPQGAELDETLAADFLTKLNGAKSRGELAEQLVDMQIKMVSDAQEAFAQAWEDTQNGWKAEMQNDATVGGAKLDANLAKAQEVINTYADDPSAMKEFLALTGAGNSIHMLKFLLKVSDALPREGAPVQGNPITEVKPREQRLFTTT